MFSYCSCSGLRFRRFRVPSGRPAGPLRTPPPKRVVASGPETDESVSKPLSRAMMDSGGLPKPGFGPVRPNPARGCVGGRFRKCLSAFKIMKCCQRFVEENETSVAKVCLKKNKIFLFAQSANKNNAVCCIDVLCFLIAHIYVCSAHAHASTVCTEPHLIVFQNIMKTEYNKSVSKLFFPHWIGQCEKNSWKQKQAIKFRGVIMESTAHANPLWSSHVCPCGHACVSQVWHVTSFWKWRCSCARRRRHVHATRMRTHHFQFQCRIALACASARVIVWCVSATSLQT